MYETLHSDGKTKGRIEFTAALEWVQRLNRQADRLGISVASYIKQALTLRMENDEKTDPELQDRSA
jgi:hypothetical protein